jgi:hypothetical protein
MSDSKQKKAYSGIKISKLGSLDEITQMSWGGKSRPCNCKHNRFDKRNSLRKKLY